MRVSQLIAIMLALTSTGYSTNMVNIGNRKVFRGSTNPCHKGRDKSNLRSGYPGAKLARKAAQGKLTIRHG